MRHEAKIEDTEHGRVPVDDLAPKLRSRGLRVEEAGDCRSPRSAEEAILEGTLAARRLSLD